MESIIEKQILNEKIHKELNNPDIENYIIGKNENETFGNIISKTKQIEKAFLTYKLNEDLFKCLNLDDIIKEPLLQNEKISLDNENLLPENEKSLTSKNKINFLDQDMKKLLDNLEEICSLEYPIKNLDEKIIEQDNLSEISSIYKSSNNNIINNNDIEQKSIFRESIIDKRKTIYEREYTINTKNSCKINLNDENDSLIDNSLSFELNDNKKENLSPINFLYMLESINEKQNEKEIDFNEYYPLEIYKSKNELNIDILKTTNKDLLYKTIENIQINDKLNCFSLDKSSSIIYSGSSLGNIYIFELSNGKIIEKINTKESEIMSINIYNNFIVTGHKNGVILIFQDNKLIDTIKDNNSSIIFVEFIKINLTKKKIELISSDLNGNVKLIIRAKGFFLNKNISEIIFESKNTPVYNIIIINNEIDFSKTKKKNMIFIFCSIFNIVIKKISKNHKKIDDEKLEISSSEKNFEKQIPDCCYGKCLIQLEKNDNNSIKELNIILISWGNQILLYGNINNEKSIKDIKLIKKVLHDNEIIKIGYLSDSFFYIIDSKFNLKIFNTFNLEDKSEEIKYNLISLKNIDLKSNGYLYYTINDFTNLTIFYSKNILTYEKGIIIIGNKEVILFELLNWADILNLFCEKYEFEKMFCLGIIIFDNLNIISKINGNYIENYKNKQSFGLIHKYYFHMIESKSKDNIIKAIKICCEFCIKSKLINTLVDFFPIIKFTNQEEIFYEIFSDYVMNGDLLNITDIDESFLKKYIEYYIDKKEKLRISLILLRFNTLILIKNEILELITKYDLLNPYIYICMNVNLEEFDYYKPIHFMFGIIEDKFEYCNYSTFIIFHNKKFYNEELLSCKQYFKHKLLWYCDLCLKGIKYPSNKLMEKKKHEDIVKKISLFLINEKTLDCLLTFDSFTYFNIFSKLYLNNNLYQIINSDYCEDFLYTVGLVNLKTTNISPKYLIYKITKYIDSMESENFYIKKDFYDFIGNICKNKEIIFNLSNDLLLNASLFLIDYNSKKSYTNDKDNFNCHSIEGIYNYNEELENQEEIILSIINKMKDVRLFYKEDAENLLKHNFHTSYKKLQLFLLKEAKHYEDYLNGQIEYFKSINLNEKNEKINLEIEKFFRWIQNSLTETKKMKDQKYFIEFKKEIINNLQNLCEISVIEFSLLIDNWFNNNIEEVIQHLENSPNFQNVYIDKFIKSYLKMEKDHEIIKNLILKKIKILIKINQEDQIVETLKQFNYVCDKKLLFFLKEQKIYDAAIYIYQILGLVDEGLNLVIEILEKNFKEIINNLNSEKFNSNIINNYRDIYFKFLSLGIQLCRENSFNNNIIKEENKEVDEFWLNFLNALYKIRTIFKPLFKENLNNEKTYDFSIVNKDLDDSINLIIGAMTEYVPIPVLIEIVSNKCKEAGLKEYAQMIRQMFLSYDITGSILKYTFMCIRKSTINKFNELCHQKIKGYYIKNFICDYCNKNIDDGNIIILKCNHCFHSECCYKINNNYYCNICEDINEIKDIKINETNIIKQSKFYVKTKNFELFHRKKNLINLTKINKHIIEDLNDIDNI